MLLILGFFPSIQTFRNKQQQQAFLIDSKDQMIEFFEMSDQDENTS